MPVLAVKSEERKEHFFSQRGVNLYNSLPEKAVMAPSREGFKRGLGNCTEVKSINGY